MAYTVQNLIADAYYSSGIVSRDFEAVSGPQDGLGLQVLNEILSDKTIEMDMIPYYTQYNFNTIPGVETYFIPNLELVSTLTFFLNGVRYQMIEVNRDQFRGSPRANITSLPLNWNQERAVNGTNISLYFFPNQIYQLEAWGLFRLSSVTMFQNLSSTDITADLGIRTVFGAGSILAGQFAINGVNIVGNFPTVTALTAYINTGIVPGVSAVFTQSTGNFKLTTSTLPSIHVSTTGGSDPTNCVTFSNFSTTGPALNQTFNSSGLDQFYTSYLKFSLADRLCTEYNLVVPQGVVKQLEQYQRWISKRTGGLDLTARKISTLQSTNSLNWAMINLSNGFTI